MTMPERRQLLYEGKAKKLYATDRPGHLLVEFKDDATAFNAQKRGTIKGKGAANNAISERVFRALEAVGVPTHFVDSVTDTMQLVRQVEIVPLEVVVRNRAAGSFAQRYGVDEGGELNPIVVEWCVKSDSLGDPPINDAAAVALGLASEDDLAAMFDLATAINDALKAYFGGLGLELVDMKLEFGRDSEGELVLADEVSPDTCRLWDIVSGERLDKDRFRRDLGGVEDAYGDVLNRVMSDAGEAEAFAATFEPPEDSPFEEAEDDHGDHDHAGHEHEDHDHARHEHDDHEQVHGAHLQTAFGAVVDVMLKPSILDPQGRAVLQTLQRLGYDAVKDVRVGKRVELKLEGELGEVRRQVAEMSEKVLSNPVMETFEVGFDDGD
ncbi:MAG TPA: phosphoribosylaminoimidazolesuccinocarboxamide synthase [Trueperaceae bacterium]